MNRHFPVFGVCLVPTIAMSSGTLVNLSLLPPPPVLAKSEKKLQDLGKKGGIYSEENHKR